MQHITREEALVQGLKRYFTGKPCKHGHIVERFTSDRSCVECRNEAGRSPEGLARKLEWTQNNREKHRASVRKSNRKYQARPENVEKRRAYDKARWENDSDYRERELARQKQHREQNPEYHAARASKRRAESLRATPKWFDELDELICDEAFDLAKRRTEATGFKWHVDHREPLKGKTVSGLHVGKNLQVIPAAKNLRKKNNQLIEEGGSPWVMY